MGVTLVVVLLVLLLLVLLMLVLVLLVDVEWMSHIQGDDDIWCSQVEQKVHKWDGKVTTEKEIKSKMATA